MKQRREHHRHQCKAGVQVDNRRAAAYRRAIGLAGEAHQAAVRLQREIVGAHVRKGTFLAVGIELAVDHAGIDRAQRLVAQAEALHRARAKIVDDDVAAFRHAQRSGPAGVRRKVDADAALVAVEGNKRGAGALGVAGRVVGHAEIARFVAAARFLDLDDVGTEVAQHLRGGRRREDAREVEDADAVEGRRHAHAVFFAAEEPRAKS